MIIISHLRVGLELRRAVDELRAGPVKLSDDGAFSRARRPYGATKDARLGAGRVARVGVLAAERGGLGGGGQPRAVRRAEELALPRAAAERSVS